MLFWAIVLETAFVLGLGGSVLALIHWRNRRKRLPFTQKILRPPGESLRLQLAELEERLNDRLFQLLLSAYSPLMVAGLVSSQSLRPGHAIWICIISIAVGASVLSAHALWKTINRIRDVRLGFEGERHVGESLNRLMLAGYHVFSRFSNHR